MMNYTKSEFYRVFITKEIYIAAAKKNCYSKNELLNMLNKES